MQQKIRDETRYGEAIPIRINPAVTRFALVFGIHTIFEYLFFENLLMAPGPHQ